MFQDFVYCHPCTDCGFLFHNRLTFHFMRDQNCSSTVLARTSTFKSAYLQRIILICLRIWWWVPMTHDLCSLNENQIYVILWLQKQKMNFVRIIIEFRICHCLLLSDINFLSTGLFSIRLQITWILLAPKFGIFIGMLSSCVRSL